MVNVTYISESRISGGDVAAAVEAILTCASERNRRDQITGALLFTGTHFVGTLEGTSANVDRMLMSIARDPRHSAIAVIDRHNVAVRKFSQWSLTYVGPSLFVAGALSRGLSDFRAGIPCGNSRMLDMMVEFGAAAPVKQKS